MLNIKAGIIKEIIDKRNNVIEVIVDINNKSERAIAYKMFLNDIKKGDKVILNTTAKDLNLGTGGYHFVIANMNDIDKSSDSIGHIMKLRYTPLQIKVDSCEEQNSIYHDVFNHFKSLDNMPIIICGLHSMVAPISVVLKEYIDNIKISYIMTDGGALPIDFSKSVDILKNNKYIDKTITVGHAFGGDIECVNIYNALIAAKDINKSDIAIIAIGPGIVGTGTKFGFSGIEQGNIIDAINDLGGQPIYVPRISFKDDRKRHFGLSHHSVTVLSIVSKTKSKIGIPIFEEEKQTMIRKQIEYSNINKKHDIFFLEYNDIIDILKESYVPMSTMGRDLKDDWDFFLTVGVNAKLAINNLCYTS